jgi:hypothetical protein
VLLRAVIAFAVAAAVAAPAQSAPPAAPTPLMPGVTYTRQVQFTPHGPVAMHVLIAPRPGGLWGLHPALSDGAISGRERLTAIERRYSTTETVAGVNGDAFDAASGRPDGIYMQGGVLASLPNPNRSSIGIGPSGQLDVRRVKFSAYYQGRGQRRNVAGINEPAPPGGLSLYTPTWGPATPPQPNAYEAVIAALPPIVPGTDVSGPVVQFTTNGKTPIPAGGAVLSAKGAAATNLATEAPPGTRVTLRFVLNAPWNGYDAIGGGPVLVQNGQPVFRAYEAFQPIQLAARSARTAIGQRRDGSIVVVAVDGGRAGYSVGMTNFELAQALVRLGCVTASALDSGDSTTMAFEGALLNRPSDPSGERPISDALLVTYDGVFAPPPAAPVLVPASGAAAQSLSYKIVRPSTVTAKVVGPDGVARFVDSGARAPGTYKFAWRATKADGSSELEGRWHWQVTAVDDLGRTTSDDEPFWVDNTLTSLRVPPSVLVRAGRRVAVAAFTLTRPARVTTTVETRNGVVVRALGSGTVAAGAGSVAWDGRDRYKHLVYAGRYVVRVRAENEFGPAELIQPLVVRRG